MAEGLTKHQLEIIADAVLKSQKKLEKEKQKKKQDWKLRNTKLLLKNYRMLSKHCEEIVEQLEGYEGILFSSNELNLQTLMKYKAKTKKLMNYFNSTFSHYKDFCKSQGISGERKICALEKMYISNPKMSAEQIAEYYNVDKRTIHRDLKKGIDELTIFLFGVDSLEDLENVT